MGTQTLRDSARIADDARFVGREQELAIFADVLDADTPSRVLFIHGPGGIGKSALLRAGARLAERCGYRAVHIDGRSLAENTDSIARLAPHGGVPKCVVIDEVDALGSSLLALRDRLLDTLADDCRLVLAGRRSLHPSWREAGLDAVLVDVRLGPLADVDACRLLAARGVADDRFSEIVSWAQGSPLALTVAASSPGGHVGGNASDELEQRLTEWLAGLPVLDVSREVLEVAALARIVDARLLSAALPSRATRNGMRRLAELPVTEVVGEALALHAVLAASIRKRLRATQPARESKLIARIAEHLAARARLGDMPALIRLSRLIEHPELRAALCNDPSDIYYADAPRSGEIAEFGRVHGFDRGADWQEIDTWLHRWPDKTLLMRRAEGHAVMVASFFAVAELPSSGAVATALRDAAAATSVDPNRSFAGVAMFAQGPAEDAVEAARLGTGAFVLQHRAGNAEAILLHYPPPDRRPPTGAIAREVPGHFPRPVAITDFRPLGVIGSVEAMVLSEHGRGPAVGGADLGSLLADDADPSRIALLRARLDTAFADNPADRRLRRAIELVHLGDRAPEAQCLAELHVSRRSWYRLLRTARERLALLH